MIAAESHSIHYANLAKGKAVTVNKMLDEKELETYRITRNKGEKIYILDN